MKTKIVCLLFFMTMSVFLKVSAQDTSTTAVAVLTNSSHPYMRDKWTPEQCESWFGKYGPIVGINCPYPPCGAISQESCLKLASEMGFNSVRWWPGGFSAADYIQNVERWAEWANKYGMTVSPVFSFSQGFFYRADHENAMREFENTVRLVIRHFRNDERIVLWDIWNEPEMTDPEMCPKVMDCIKDMVMWCREEGCTQPITASIIWDAGINSAQLTPLRKIRNEAEAMMDLHNFHDYSVSEDFGRNVSVMASRIGKIDSNPMVCTECLTRPNGSGVARSLCEFSKYKIHFYTWGLYSCDANWEVKWGRSTFYAWEPMFHNLLYADGDPYDPAELEIIKNFKFSPQGLGAHTGVEYTERWTPRRAWKWMDNGAVKGLVANNIGEALSLIDKHKTDGLYNSINVSLSFSDYNGRENAFFKSLDNLFFKANEAGMTVLPTLISNENMSETMLNLANYVYAVISKYYDDSRVKGWNLLTQNVATDENKLERLLSYLFNRVRYIFPNQPMFVTPLISESVTPDESGKDITNLMWRLSDVIAFTVADGFEIGDDLYRSVYTKLKRPSFYMGIRSLKGQLARCHVNWYAADETNSQDVRGFEFEPLYAPVENYSGRMEGWQAYAQLNRKPIKGLSYTSVNKALKGIAGKVASKLYNSVCVSLNFDVYMRTPEKFFTEFDELLKVAGNAHMTVLPTLLNDRYALRNMDVLKNYVNEIIRRYDKDDRILAWNLYNKPCVQNIDRNKVMDVLEEMFDAARSQYPVKPVFATPNVSTEPFPADYDYIEDLRHGNGSAGWNKLTYGKSDVEMCYRIWCLSDVIAYESSQNYPELGWLNSVAYRFGRPLFCTCWQVSENEAPSKVLSVFRNMHVKWYVDGNLDDGDVENFKYDVIITRH